MELSISFTSDFNYFFGHINGRKTGSWSRLLLIVCVHRPISTWKIVWLVICSVILYMIEMNGKSGCNLLNAMCLMGFTGFHSVLKFNKIGLLVQPALLI